MSNPSSLGDLPAELRPVVADVTDAAELVHAELGPGLPPRIQRLCLAIELRELGRVVETDVPYPLTYRGVSAGVAFRADLLVDDRVVVDVREVPETVERAKAALRTGLRIAGRSAGVLLDVGAPSVDEADHLVQL